MRYIDHTYNSTGFSQLLYCVNKGLLGLEKIIWLETENKGKDQ